MTLENKKAEEERDAFLRFAERSRKSHKWLSVESRKPAEPDLLCVHVDAGPIAFELVQICDPNIAQIQAAGANAYQFSISTSDPSERIIRNKLKKTYKTPYPVELLIYSEGVVITPDDVIIPTITLWCDAIVHPFRKVWFMGEKEVGCIWSAS